MYNNKPMAEYYHPKDVTPSLPSVLMEEKQRIWNRMIAETFYLYRSYMSRTGSFCKELLQTYLDLAFEGKYRQKIVIAIYSYLNILRI
jgi:hypothetical protein